MSETVPDLISCGIPLELMRGVGEAFTAVLFLKSGERMLTRDGLRYIDEHNGSDAQLAFRDTVTKWVAKLLKTPRMPEGMFLAVYPKRAGRQEQHRDRTSRGERRIRIVVCLAKSDQHQHQVKFYTTSSSLYMLHVDKRGSKRRSHVPGTETYIQLGSGGFYIMNSHAAGIKSTVEHKVPRVGHDHAALIIDVLARDKDHEAQLMRWAAAWCAKHQQVQPPGMRPPLWLGLSDVTRGYRTARLEGDAPCVEMQIDIYNKLVHAGIYKYEEGITAQGKISLAAQWAGKLSEEVKKAILDVNETEALRLLPLLREWKRVCAEHILVPGRKRLRRHADSGQVPAPVLELNLSNDQQGLSAHPCIGEKLSSSHQLELKNALAILHQHHDVAKAAPKATARPPAKPPATSNCTAPFKPKAQPGSKGGKSSGIHKKSEKKKSAAGCSTEPMICRPNSQPASSTPASPLRARVGFSPSTTTTAMLSSTVARSSGAARAPRATSPARAKQAFIFK
jgi:hypothetical protein